jgi:GGDEF domain-containing protein
MGVAVFPDDAGTVETLIERADAALYRAKSRGKNGVMSYGELDLTNPS